jgi:hypothetical protein
MQKKSYMPAYLCDVLCLFAWRSWIDELDAMHQSGELKAFLHSLDPRVGDEVGQTANPLAGAQPHENPRVRHGLPTAKLRL